MLFLFAIGSMLSYFTYAGIGQEKIETVEKEKTIRSNSYRTGGSYGGGSNYNSSGYSYGK